MGRRGDAATGRCLPFSGISVIKSMRSLRASLSRKRIAQIFRCVRVFFTPTFRRSFMSGDPVQQDHILRSPFEFSFGHDWQLEERANSRFRGPEAMRLLSDFSRGKLSFAQTISSLDIRVGHSSWKMDNQIGQPVCIASRAACRMTQHLMPGEQTEEV